MITSIFDVWSIGNGLSRTVGQCSPKARTIRLSMATNVCSLGPDQLISYSVMGGAITDMSRFAFVHLI